MAAEGHRGDILYCGQELLKEQHLRSRNGNYTLVMQGDGNFVSYKATTHPATPIWHANTTRQGVSAKLLNDGRLVVLNAAGAHAWASPAGPLPIDNYRLVMQNDGNVVLYTSADVPVWSTHSSPKAFGSA
ncbi:hypothetical protein L7F22_057672 [Adiantum nelumboides]|nr:hypothetical protein [Adiantum nelumboides]